MAKCEVCRIKLGGRTHWLVCQELTLLYGGIEGFIEGL